MFLADSHTHSLCSPDGYSSMAELAEAAVHNGVSILTVTDHVDLDYCPTGNFDGYCFDIWPDMLEDFCEANLLPGFETELRIGLELGEASHYPVFAEEIAKTPGLDFIIGSIHSVRHTPDFFCLHYESRAQCERLVDQYLAEHFELARSKAIDVIGHLGYTRRYMKRAGFDIDFDTYADVLDGIFRAAIGNGVGFELNTSGLRQGLGSTIPAVGQIKRYRELGGELITVGSDAHFPEGHRGRHRGGLRMPS